MLKDLPANWKLPQDVYVQMLRSLATAHIDQGHTDWRPTRVYPGVYLAHINFDKEIDDLIVNRWPSFDFEIADWFNAYGVVDSWTQLPLTYLESDPRNLLVFLGRHTKAEQPAEGGWRWHKWGPYLGIFREQVKQNEYLHDTPDVVEVWSYQTVEIRVE